MLKGEFSGTTITILVRHHFKGIHTVAVDDEITEFGRREFVTLTIERAFESKS